jgi:soluble lytic murein transglycosylase-like protein
MKRLSSVLVVLVVLTGVAAVGYLGWRYLDDVRDSGRLGGTVVVPAAYTPVIREAAERCRFVPAPVLAAQIAAESSWNPEAISPAGAQGIAQFMPSTWKQYGIDGDGDGIADVWNPIDAIHSAAKMNCVNRRLVRKVEGQLLENVLAAYNAGHGAVRRHNGIPPYPETEQYVDRVLTWSQTLTFEEPATP